MIWTQLAQKGEHLPKPRSGHSLTWVGNTNYVIYGGIEDPETSVKVVPNSDVWSLKVLPSKCQNTFFVPCRLLLGAMKILNLWIRFYKLI